MQNISADQGQEAALSGDPATRSAGDAHRPRVHHLRPLLAVLAKNRAASSCSCAASWKRIVSINRAGFGLII